MSGADASDQPAPTRRKDTRASDLASDPRTVSKDRRQRAVAFDVLQRTERFQIAGSDSLSSKPSDHDAVRVKLNRAARDRDVALKTAARADRYGVGLGSTGGAASSGRLELDHGEVASELHPRDLFGVVDVATRRKVMSLNLSQYGPYCFAFNDNGRSMVLGGSKGHIAILDWQDARLRSEAHVKQIVRDICFIQDNTMFAAAQRSYVYVYDQKCAELHCLDRLAFPRHLTYLPAHYLLVSASNNCSISWLDVSVGSVAAAHPTHRPPSCLCANPQTAVCALGSTTGVITLWSPRVSSPLVTMLTHTGAVTAAAFSPDGVSFVTAGSDAVARVWDARTLKVVRAIGTGGVATSVAISGRGTVAIGVGSRVTTFTRDALLTPSSSFPADEAIHGDLAAADASRARDGVYMSLGETRPVDVYLQATMPSQGEVKRVQFCPFEDVLGVGHAGGVDTIIVPGAGDPHPPSFGPNPYSTLKQRRERAVHRLMDKLGPDTIVFDPSSIAAAPREGVEVLQTHKQSARVAYLKKKAEAKKRQRTSLVRELGGRVIDKDDGEAMSDSDIDSVGSDGVGSHGSADSQDWRQVKQERKRNKKRSGVKGHKTRQALKDERRRRQSTEGKLDRASAAAAVSPERATKLREKYGPALARFMV